MSLLLGLMMPFQACIIKDDTAVFPVTEYNFTEVNRWDVTIHHRWPRSGFINCFDSTSDANCPNNVFASNEDAWEYPELNNPRNGCRTNVVYKIQGVTKDSGGSPLGGVWVYLHRASDGLRIDSVLSDAAGNYQLFTPYYPDYHYCVTFGTGLAGATINTLQGTLYPS